MICYVARNSDAEDGWDHKLGVVATSEADLVNIKVPAENTIIELSEINESVAKELNIRQYKPRFVVVDVKFVHQAISGHPLGSPTPYIRYAYIYIIVCHKHDKVVNHNKITEANTL